MIKVWTIFITILGCGQTMFWSAKESGNPEKDAFRFEDHFEVCEDVCRMSVSCWVKGGLVVPEHQCGSMFQVCCRDQGLLADPRKYPESGTAFRNTIDQGPFPDVQFGPVVNEPDCGIPKMSRRRVVGGRDAGFGTFPWQALIRIGHSRCGGALVGRQHVVTAGHCVHAVGKNGSARLVRVFLGEYSLFSDLEPLPRQLYGVDKIFLHPFYQFEPQADRYDVAVLKLSRPVRYDWHVWPLCLPDKDLDLPEGTVAMVAGWGATKPNSPGRPRELQAVDVKTVPGNVCERWHRAKNIHVRSIRFLNT